MKYQLSIRDHNIQPHIDIEKDIKDRKNGLFTFTLRINRGFIVDYNVTEYVNAKQKYLSLKRIVVEERIVAHNYRAGSKPNPLWPNYIQHGATRGSSQNRNLKHSQEQKKKI